MKPSVRDIARVLTMLAFVYAGLAALRLVMALQGGAWTSWLWFASDAAVAWWLYKASDYLRRLHRSTTIGELLELLGKTTSRGTR